jgi:hypothetical protein
MEPLSKQTILMLGALGAGVVVLWSFAKWRAAVKAALFAALLEGAIRKWVLPQGQELVYFLKDFFLLGAYLRFFIFPDQKSKLLKVPAPALLLGVTGAVVALSALNPNLNSFLAALLGVKIYLFYIPLAFMMPHLFKDEKDLARQCSWFALMAIPICTLGFLQFKSPTYSVLNVYAHDMEALNGVAVFGTDTQYARITGTFSYISGMATFLVLFTGLCMALLASPYARFRPVIIFVILPMLVANGLMSGSRAAVLGQVIMVVAFVLASPLIGLSQRMSRAQHSILAVVLAAVVANYFFRDAKQAYDERAYAEGTKREMELRVMWPIKSVFVAFGDGGLAGLGIGLTHPATEALRRAAHLPPPRKYAPFYEAEPGQIALELGLAGFVVWYFMRFYLLWMTWKAFRFSPPGLYKALAIVCFTYSAMEMEVQFLFNHTAQFYYWAFYGVILTPFARTLKYGKREPVPARDIPAQTGTATPSAAPPRGLPQHRRV